MSGLTGSINLMDCFVKIKYLILVALTIYEGMWACSSLKKMSKQTEKNISIRINNKNISYMGTSHQWCGCSKT